mmetsp:Transcript_8947/g.13760  ORF Transcript_8947/g.13760 Transcript_8947/m.13760 type:complete len:256 (-) Transcript_8947:154-921(-)|eukprot:CAMPEP_0178924876 /NCGR_PEP_ID=MMETSP0786-20121207/17573_1 /TAXON_ID=186022 /ORGANISM="Thalassionema frauenfeldii, Strain CCMP 1798" /LENGTH=255 /DNA_ID=CAMNT_0020599641 /DNA_START=3 /DNA_END=770 /DNA_ORIENTATION=+
MTEKTFLFQTFRDVYELHGAEDDLKTKRGNDPLKGKIRFGTTIATEINKSVNEVKGCLFDPPACPEWHPFVEHTELKKDGTNEAVTVRKCGFYPELKQKGIPEYVWEEISYISDTLHVAFIQAENRPFPVSYVGKVFHVKELNANKTLLTVTHTFRPKFMPFTTALAKGPMKRKMAEETYAICWCVKHRIETGEVAKYDMVPKIELEEVIGTISSGDRFEPKTSLPEESPAPAPAPEAHNSFGFVPDDSDVEMEC